MSEYMAAKMDDQITGAVSDNESLRAEVATLRAALAERQAASVDDVIAERQRQINVEGWTPEHYDAHSNREMAIAAACYALAAAHSDYRLLGNPDFWPWDHKWWKPTTPRRDLVKAAALILAEIDRLDRSAARALATKEPVDIGSYAQSVGWDSGLATKEPQP